MNTVPFRDETPSGRVMRRTSTPVPYPSITPRALLRALIHHAGQLTLPVDRHASASIQGFTAEERIHRAWAAFKERAYLLLVDERAAQDLDDPLHLNHDATVTLLHLR